MSRNDGVLDAWDLYYRQSSPSYSHKISSLALSTVSVQGSAQTGGGRLLAVGDVGGSVTLLEMSDNLAVPEAHEKNAIGVMFERESKREENLEKRALALARAARAAASKAPASPKEEGKEGGGGGASGDDGPGGAAGIEVLDPATLEALGKIDATFRALVGEEGGGGSGGDGGGGGGAEAGPGETKQAEAK